MSEWRWVTKRWIYYTQNLKTKASAIDAALYHTKETASIVFWGWTLTPIQGGILLIINISLKKGKKTMQEVFLF